MQKDAIQCKKTTFSVFVLILYGQLHSNPSPQNITFLLRELESRHN